MMAKGKVQLHGLNVRSAPLEVLEHPRLSAPSKVLLTWLFMHGNDWEFIISYALKSCGITESSWKRSIKQELIKEGFFTQERRSEMDEKTGRQQIVWDNLISNEPLFKR